MLIRWSWPRLARRAEHRLAATAEHLWRRYPRLARSWLAIPLRLLLARSLLATGIVDLYSRDCVRDVAGGLAMALECLSAADKSALIAPAVRPERWRAAFGLGAGDDIALHYAVHWQDRARAPAECFDPTAYLAANPDVRLARLNPLRHFLIYGQHEGRQATAPALPCPDLSDLHPRPVDPRPSRVCVIVPVHGARSETLRCLASVLRAPVTLAHRIVVVDDGSPDARLSDDLRALAARGAIGLIVHAANRGFSASVNAALATLRPGEDAVLLNSDTEVFGNWLDRLAAHAHSGGKIATVTPLSNAATILSYPVRLRDTAGPLEIGWDGIDAIASTLALPPIEIPTAIGFCMYVRGDCLADVGLLDAEAFPRGYGEENDFCLRATALGWRHLAACDTFVHHRGAASFGTEREALIAAGLAVIDRRYPDYRDRIDRFIAADPLAPVRQALDYARIRRSARPGTVRLWRSPADGRLHLHCPAIATPSLTATNLPHSTATDCEILERIGPEYLCPHDLKRLNPPRKTHLRRSP